MRLVARAKFSSQTHRHCARRLLRQLYWCQQDSVLGGVTHESRSANPLRSSRRSDVVQLEAFDTLDEHLALDVAPVSLSLIVPPT